MNHDKPNGALIGCMNALFLEIIVLSLWGLVKLIVGG
jgi:hypothetical protein